MPPLPGITYFLMHVSGNPCERGAERRRDLMRKKEKEHKKEVSDFDVVCVVGRERECLVVHLHDHHHHILLILLPAIS
jgi:hypothetical protein